MDTSFKQSFNTTDTKYEILLTRISWKYFLSFFFKVTGTRTHYPFSPCCAPLSWTTTNLFLISSLFRMDTKFQVYYTFGNTLSYWLKLALVINCSALILDMTYIPIWSFIFLFTVCQKTNVFRELNSASLRTANYPFPIEFTKAFSQLSLFQQNKNISFLFKWRFTLFAISFGLIKHVPFYKFSMPKLHFIPGLFSSIYVIYMPRNQK